MKHRNPRNAAARREVQKRGSRKRTSRVQHTPLSRLALIETKRIRTRLSHWLGRMGAVENDVTGFANLNAGPNGPIASARRHLNRRLDEIEFEIKGGHRDDEL